jgi:hypothetical protein
MRSRFSVPCSSIGMSSLHPERTRVDLLGARALTRIVDANCTWQSGNLQCFNPAGMVPSCVLQ